MPSQRDTDDVLNQRAHEEVVDERLDGVTAENVAIASLSPATASAAYVQAEATAARGAINSILTALRNSGIIPPT